MNVLFNKIKQFMKKLFDFSEENSSVEIVFPKENNSYYSEEDEVYKNMLRKIKQNFKYIINSFKKVSDTEIVFSKEENCNFIEKENK